MSSYQRTRAWRDAHPESVKQERRRNAARQRALVKLAREHQEDYRRIYHGELEAAGIARARATQFDGRDDAS